MYSKSGMTTQAYVCIMALPVDKRLDELDAGLIRQGFEVPVCVAEHRYPNHRWQRLSGGSPQPQSRAEILGTGQEERTSCRVKQISPEHQRESLSTFPSLLLMRF